MRCVIRYELKLEAAVSTLGALSKFGSRCSKPALALRAGSSSGP